MFGLGATVEAVDELILSVLYVVLDMSYRTAAAWSQFMASIIVYIGAFTIGCKLTRYAMSTGTLIASHLSPPQPTDTRRERRIPTAAMRPAPVTPSSKPHARPEPTDIRRERQISTAAVRPAPATSSSTPHARPDYLSSSLDITYQDFWPVNKRPCAQRIREDNAIIHRGNSEKPSRQRYKFNSHGKMVPREQLTTACVYPRSVWQPNNICMSAEPDTHASPATAEMSVPSAVSRLTAPVVASSSTGLATGTVSPEKGPVKPLQCRSAPVLAPAPVSTDEMAKLIRSDSVANAPTWRPSSGPVYKLRKPDPRFTTTTATTVNIVQSAQIQEQAPVPTWRPSSGPVYRLRGPDPRFTTNNPLAVHEVQSVPEQQQAPVPTWRPSSGPVYKLRGPDPRFATNTPLAIGTVKSVLDRERAPAPTWKPSSGPVYMLREPDSRFATNYASSTVSAVQTVTHVSTPEPAPIPPALPVPVTSAQALSICPERTCRGSALPRRDLPVYEACKAVTSTPAPTLAATLAPPPPMQDVLAISSTQTHLTAPHNSPSRRSVPLGRDSVSETRKVAAPAPELLSATTLNSTLASTTVAACPTPSASVAGIYPMTEQNWMRPIPEMLALDIERWGMSEEELMAWKVSADALAVSQLGDKAAEERARRDPFTLASRYGGIAVELKKSFVLLRLQLAHSRPFFRPDYENFNVIRKMILTATVSFTRLSEHSLDSDDFPGVDFSLFRNALGFFLNHIVDDPTFLIWVRESRLNYGSDIIAETKRKVKYVNAIAGGKHSRAAHRLAQS